MHDVTLSRFVFLSQLFNGCAGMPYLFFNARRDSLGLSTVINTMYIFFYFSLCPMRYLSRTCETPQRHAPTTTPLPLPKRRARFMQVRTSHPLPNSTGPYLVYGGPSTSAILFYQFSLRHHRHLLLLLLPILTVAAYTLLPPTSPYLHAIFFSLSNHVISSSGTPTYAVHLRVAPPPHQRRRGRGGPTLTVYSSTYHSSGTPTFEVLERVLPGISINYLALLRH